MTERRLTTPADWTDLQFLVELARHGNLSAAARALGVTHATVSRRLGSMERKTGQPLFVRKYGRWITTPLGEQIVALATQMEAPALRIKRAMAGLLPEIAGPVRITATEMVATELVAPALAGIRTRYPGLDVDLIVTGQNLSLARRDADIALRLGAPTQRELVRRRLGRLAYYHYAARRYLAGRKSDDWDYIGYCNVSPELPEVQEFERAHGSARIVLRTNLIGARRAAVQNGIGIGLLPKLIVRDEMDLVCLDAKPAVLRELWLIVHRDMRTVPRIRRCMDELTAAVASQRQKLA